MILGSLSSSSEGGHAAGATVQERDYTDYGPGSDIFDILAYYKVVLTAPTLPCSQFSIGFRVTDVAVDEESGTETTTVNTYVLYSGESETLVFGETKLKTDSGGYATYHRTTVYVYWRFQARQPENKQPLDHDGHLVTAYEGLLLYNGDSHNV